MLSGTAVVITFLLSLPFILWYIYLYKFRVLNKIPGPIPLPIIGNALELGTTPVEVLKNFCRLGEKYGHVYKVFIGPSVRVVLINPELLETILTSNKAINKSVAYDLMKPWLGEGLLVSTDEKWRLRRKIITPCFHFKILEEFVEVFLAMSDTLIQRLLGISEEEPVDITPYTSEHSLNVICASAMGLKVNDEQFQNLYVKSVHEFLDIAVVRFFSVWQSFSLLFIFSSNYNKQNACVKTLHNFSNTVIKDRKSTVEQDISEIDKKRKTALLDMLLDQRKINNLSDEDIREEVDTFIFEGHDTVNAALSFAMYCLSINPGIQQKVYEEIQSVIGPDKTNSEITIHKLQQMTYMDMVIKEVERMYPSVPLIERHLKEKITVGDITYPANTTITMLIYATHHSEKYFPNPEKFDPDRFLPENVQQRHTFSYIPFSAGPRNCIGQKFAALVLKTSITKILQCFQILPVPGFSPLLGMSGSLHSYNGILVKLRKR